MWVREENDRIAESMRDSLCRTIQKSLIKDYGTHACFQLVVPNKLNTISLDNHYAHRNNLAWLQAKCFYTVSYVISQPGPLLALLTAD